MQNYHWHNKRAALRYLFICIAIFLTACQPTPGSDAVVNKAAASMDDMVLVQAGPEDAWAQPKERIVWNETKSVNTDIGGCKVAASMDVKAPDYPGPVPVYLIEPAAFSMNFLKTASEYLLIGEILDGRASKPDVMAEILDFEQDVSTHTVLDGYQSQVDEWRDTLNKTYENAPENNSEAKYEYTVDSKYGLNGLSLKSYIGDRSYRDFSVTADGEGNCDTFYFRVEEINRSFYDIHGISGENIQANGTRTTYGQALEIANSTLTTLFKEPFTMVHASLIDKINYLEYLWNDGEDTSLGQAYVFCFTREYDGIPSLYIQPAPIFATENTPDFVKPYTREYVQIAVDDRGVVYMTCQSYSNMVKKLNENVRLMPFEEILAHFKDDVFYHSLWGNSVEVNIARIEFGMVREPVKDNPNQYMMVPAWNFIGDVKSEYVEGQGSILALNAVDGSIITDYASVRDPK